MALRCCSNTNILHSFLYWFNLGMIRIIISRLFQDIKWVNSQGKIISVHLPQSIIETILAKVPTRDAVRTSILSKKWRYQWATMTQLVLDEEYMGFSGYRNVSKNKILRFIVRYFYFMTAQFISSKYLLYTP